MPVSGMGMTSQRYRLFLRPQSMESVSMLFLLCMIEMGVFFN